MCCERIEALVKESRFGFYGLIFYILLGFYIVNLHLWPFLTVFTHPLSLWALNGVGILSLASLFRSHSANPGYVSEDWVLSSFTFAISLCRLTRRIPTYHR